LSLFGRGIVEIPAAAEDLAVQGDEAGLYLLDPQMGTLPEDRRGRWEVALYPAMLAPVDDGVKPEHDPAGVTGELDEAGELRHDGLPRGDARLERTSAQSSDGEVAKYLIISRQDPKHPRIGE
jgi:hypothetical protein